MFWNKSGPLIVSLLPIEAQMDALHSLINAWRDLRLWLHCWNVLSATATHSTVTSAIPFLRCVVPRILEVTFIGRRFHLRLSLWLFVILYFFLKNSITNLLANTLHSLHLLSSNTFFRNFKALSAWATSGLRKALQEVRGETDRFQLG